MLPAEVGDLPDLMKQLRSTIERQKVRSFQDYRNQGLDSETAAELSGLDELPASERAGAILSYAHLASPGEKIASSVSFETQNSLRNVGAAAGTAIGSAMGGVLLRTAVRHSGTFVLGGVAVVGGVAAVAAANVVSASMGKVAAVVAAANIVCATGLVAWALYRRVR